MTRRTTDFKKLNRRLDELQKELPKNEEGVPVETLLTDRFMSSRTSFPSIAEFFRNSNFNAKTQEDFENIDRKDMDAYVSGNTNFETWDAMLQAALEAYLKENVGS